MSRPKIHGIEKRDATFTLYRHVRDGDFQGGMWGMKGEIMEAVAGVPKFLVTNVADMLSEGAGLWGASRSELNGIRVRPSFRRQWLEASVSGDIKPLREGEHRPAGQRVGGFVERYPPSMQSTLYETIKAAGGKLDTDGPSLEEFFAQSSEMVNVHLFEGARYDGRFVSFGKALVLFGLDDEGRTLKDSPSIISLSPWVTSLLDAEGQLDERKDARASGSLFLYAFGLMNCKNSKVHERSFTPSPMKRKTEKIPLDDVPIRYHIVTVKVGGDDDDESNRGGPSGHMPLHICRGHFRRYTDEAPLFGKLTGTFWIPAHTRGSPAEGVVLKDYEQETGEPA